MATKVCTRCKIEKEYSEFAPNKELRDGRSSHCRQCHQEYGRSLYYREHDAVLERGRIYRENNRELCNERASDWARRNKAQRCIYEQQRRARKRNAPGNGVTVRQWMLLLAEYDYRCVACGSRDNITMDHVVPLLLGGAHDITNIQPLCLSCNSAKRDKTIDYRERSTSVLYTQDRLL